MLIQNQVTLSKSQPVASQHDIIAATLSVHGALFIWPPLNFYEGCGSVCGRRRAGGESLTKPVALHNLRLQSEPTAV